MCVIFLKYTTIVLKLKETKVLQVLSGKTIKVWIEIELLEVKGINCNFWGKHQKNVQANL